MTDRQEVAISYSILEDTVASLLYSMRLVDESLADIVDIKLTMPKKKGGPVIINYTTKDSK